MSLDLDAIEAQYRTLKVKLAVRTLAEAQDFALAMVADIPALVARVRELEAQLQGLDYRAHPDHYRHNLQRAEEAAAEYLAALEAARAENDRLRAELEQAENAAFCECGRVNL